MTTTHDEPRTPAWRRYLRLLRPNAAGDVDDELAFHLQSTIDEYVAAGLSPQAARDAARRKFGDVDRIANTLYTLSQQRERTMNRSEWWHSVKQDVAFALRQLRKSPGFTIVALLTLALGIGANSAIFSVVNAVMLAPLPYANSGRVLRLWERFDGDPNAVTFGNYGSWTRARSFEAIAAWWSGAGSTTLTGRGDPVRIEGTLATASYWRVFQIKPVLGSYFGEDDAREGASPVVVLSAALWQNRFGGDSSIVGKSIMLGGTPTRVVGVAPQAYILDETPERIWMPLIMTPKRLADHRDHELSAAGLVKRGVSFDQATQELSRITRALALEYPNSRFDDSYTMPMAESIIGTNGKTLYMLFGAVGLVLLIACANVANLLIARAARRRGEIAVRGALGASRGRIIRQLLVESLVIGVAGGVLGLLVGYAGIRFLVTSPVSVPRLQNAALSPAVVWFTLVLSIGCALLFGLVPALRAARADLQQTLRDGGREAASGSRDTLRGLLVVAELCLAQVLLIGAGLLIRSMMMLTSVPIGFDTHNLFAASIALPVARYPDAASWDAAFRQIEQNVAAIPGVRSVGRSQVVPIYGGGWNWTAMREGSDGHDAGATVADMRSASPDYFRTLGLPMLRGRSFTNADGPDAPPVAIVSRSLAKRLYGDADPIGRRISNGSVEKPNWREIVGVVDDMRANGPRDEAPLTFYMPASVFANPSQTLLVRGNVPVLTLVPQIRRALAGVDAQLALSGPSTIDASLGRLLALPRFTMLLLGLLGATGLVLATIGVYGVISYFVTQRTHEFGVRLALGASGGAVRWLVVRQGLQLAVIGTTLGVVLALFAARLLSSFLFGVTARDPLTFVVVPATLSVVALAASYIPARRATRIDPLEALRST